MGAIGYLYKRTLINRARMALRRPVTYLYLALLLFYFLAVPSSLRILLEDTGAAWSMAGVLTVLAFWLIPANLIAYAKRRGLVYRHSDVHFLFPAPISPKQVLLYAYLRTLFMQILLNLFAVVCGRVLFRAEGWRLAAYFVFSVFIENLLEAGIMLLLYGSERMQERERGLVIKLAYGLVIILLGMGLHTCVRQGFCMDAVAQFLHSDMLQLVPVIGWYIAVVHLLFAEATVVNVAGTVCYGLLLVCVLAAAWRMKCSGGFYEDAMKFAEDYEEVLESRRQGNAAKRLGKKENFAKARIRWRGHGASALFYRQLLEHKKSRYFIFDINTVVAILAGGFMAYLYRKEGGFGDLDSYRALVLAAVGAYMIFIFTGFGGKWAKELKSPYTYLIPDAPFRKLMAATLIQHVQALVNGCLMMVPCALVMGLALPEALLCILFYMALSGNKLYSLAVAQLMAGSSSGATVKQLLQMLLLSVAIFVGIMGAMAGMRAGGVPAALGIMDVFLILFSIIYMVIAALNFYDIET